MRMKIMPSSEKKSSVSGCENNNVFSPTKIYSTDTSKTTTWYQDRLLYSLLEGNFQNFSDLAKREIIDMNYFHGAPYHGTLLDIACRTKGMGEFVKIILQKEVNVNAINEFTGKAAIHEAIENSAVDVVDVLNRYRCSTNIKDRDGNTPLHSAIKRNDLQIIKLLLESNRRRIDINISNRQNPTPLHIALLEGYTEAAILLLKYPYVDLDFQTDSEGRTCRQIIQERYPKLNEELLLDPTRYAGDPASILFSLLKRGETEVFIELASKMSTEFLEDDYGGCKNDERFLQRACLYGYVDVVDMLLKKGVDPNKTTAGANVRENTPILIAAENGYYDIFVKLLNHPEIELKISGAPADNITLEHVFDNNTNALNVTCGTEDVYPKPEIKLLVNGKEYSEEIGQPILDVRINENQLFDITSSYAVPVNILELTSRINCSVTLPGIKDNYSRSMQYNKSGFPGIDYNDTNTVSAQDSTAPDGSTLNLINSYLIWMSILAILTLTREIV